MFWAAVENPNEPDLLKRSSCNDLPFWVDNGEAPPPQYEEAITPETLAALAYQHMQLPDTEVTLAPEQTTKVNLPTWAWLDEAVFDEVQATAALNVPGFDLQATTTARSASPTRRARRTAPRRAASSTSARRATRRTTSRPRSPGTSPGPAPAAPEATSRTAPSATTKPSPSRKSRQSTAEAPQYHGRRRERSRYPNSRTSRTSWLATRTSSLTLTCW